MDLLEQLKLSGLIPVIKIDDISVAGPVAQALQNGGLSVAEITFRTDCAVKTLHLLAQKCPSLLLGAGTVLTTTQVDMAVDAGAQFVVSPGFNPSVVEYSLKKGITPIPGVNNPSLIEQATEWGLKVIKFFPAEQSGGVAMLKTFASVYPDMRFIPTGGIKEKNLADYARLTNVWAVGGSWMVSADLLRARDFASITQLTKQAVMALHSFTIAHIGINQDSAQDAADLAHMLSTLFGWQDQPTPISHFLGTGKGNQVEVMQPPYRGEKGHIAVHCNNVERAVAFFEHKGFTFDKDSCVYGSNGLKLIYFAKEIGGFAWHLVAL